MNASERARTREGERRSEREPGRVPGSGHRRGGEKRKVVRGRDFPLRTLAQNDLQRVFGGPRRRYRLRASGASATAPASVEPRSSRSRTAAHAHAHPNDPNNTRDRRTTHGFTSSPPPTSLAVTHLPPYYLPIIAIHADDPRGRAPRIQTRSPVLQRAQGEVRPRRARFPSTTPTLRVRRVGWLPGTDCEAAALCENPRTPTLHPGE